MAPAAAPEAPRAAVASAGRAARHAGHPAWHDRRVSDLEIPADLIQLKRDFLRQEMDLAEVAARMPSAAAIVADEATVTPDDQTAWDVLWQQQDETVRAIHRHPALDGLTRQQQAEMQAGAMRAARATA